MIGLVGPNEAFYFVVLKKNNFSFSFSLSNVRFITFDAVLIMKRFVWTAIARLFYCLLTDLELDYYEIAEKSENNLNKLGQRKTPQELLGNSITRASRLQNFGESIWIYLELEQEIAKNNTRQKKKLPRSTDAKISIIMVTASLLLMFCHSVKMNKRMAEAK